MKAQILERFLRYVSFDTQSDPESETYPSTAKQLLLLNHLVEEMFALGMREVEIDQYGYVMGTVPPSPGCEHLPTIGFIAHVDTSPDMSGANVCPRVVDDYDGGDIVLGQGYVLRVGDFPELISLRGQTLITTDGTTLLGADDKAGIAEIMTAAEYLLTHPDVPHPRIRVAFTPDEEIGRGVDFFKVENFGARYAYTMDGATLGELEFENFNAAQAKIQITGRNIHPGYAKGKMINALQVAADLNAMLPLWERPEVTEGYEGFYHLVALNGGVESASVEYIIRDHSMEKFQEKKDIITKIANHLNGKYGEGTIELVLRDQYYNMRDMVEPHRQVIKKAIDAIKSVGVEPIVRPIRGGTDGSRLSYMGLPCPNLFTGGMNFHGRYEYCSLDTMLKATRTIVALAELWTHEN